MAKLMTLKKSFLLFSGLLVLVGCNAKDNGSIRGPKKLTYEYKENVDGIECTTGFKVFSDKLTYCESLKSEAINNSCAKTARLKEYQSQCTESRSKSFTETAKDEDIDTVETTLINENSSSQTTSVSSSVILSPKVSAPVISDLGRAASIVLVTKVSDIKHNIKKTGGTIQITYTIDFSKPKIMTSEKGIFFLEQASDVVIDIPGSKFKEQCNATVIKDLKGMYSDISKMSLKITALEKMTIPESKSCLMMMATIKDQGLNVSFQNAVLKLGNTQKNVNIGLKATALNK
ncbi:MAG: hypothetical protein ACK41T_08710 [Pseudobdellovibrio sp.]